MVFCVNTNNTTYALSECVCTAEQKAIRECTGSRIYRHIHSPICRTTFKAFANKLVDQSGKLWTACTRQVHRKDHASCTRFVFDGQIEKKSGSERVLFGGIAGGWLNIKGTTMLFDVLTSYIYNL